MIDEKKLDKEIADWFKKAIDNGNHEVDTVDTSAVVRHIIDNQPRVGEWIPISEREPKEPEDGLKRYIVQRASNAEPRSLYWDQYGTWLDEEGTPYTDIIAWMELPEPYKEGE